MFVVASLFFYALSDVLIKYFFNNFNLGVAQVTFLRAITRLIPLLIVSIAIGYRTHLNPLAIFKPWPHFFNSIIGCGRTYSFMLAYSIMPLAECSALGYTSAIFFIILASFFLNEKIHYSHLIALALSIIAIIIAIRPGIDNMIRYGALIALCGSFLAALSKLFIKKLSFHDDPIAISIYPNIFLIIITLPFLYNNWVSLNLTSALLFAVIGIMAAIAQYLYALSLKYAHALTIAPYDYTYFIWILAMDLVFNNLLPNTYSLIGAFLIICANIIILVTECRKNKINNET